MANPTLPRPANRRQSPMTGFAYAIIPSLILWALIAVAIWAA